MWLILIPSYTQFGEEIEKFSEFGKMLGGNQHSGNLHLDQYLRLKRAQSYKVGV